MIAVPILLSIVPILSPQITPIMHPYIYPI